MRMTTYWRCPACSFSMSDWDDPYGLYTIERAVEYHEHEVHRINPRPDFITKAWLDRSAEFGASR